MTFAEVIEKLRDGKAYDFGHKHLAGHFYKAPYPADDRQTEIDGSLSAITFWNGIDRASPCLMLYDFDDDAEWYCREASNHPTLRS